ncbi:MAG: PAS domain-containing sensor histidine kinase [Bacteroidota bacterium]
MLRKALAHREGLLAELEAGDGVQREEPAPAPSTPHRAQARPDRVRPANAAGLGSSHGLESIHLLLVTDQLPWPVVAADPSGHIHFSNRAARRWFDESAMAEVSQWLAGLPIDTDGVQRGHAHLNGQGPVALSARRVQLDGQPVWIGTAHPAAVLPSDQTDGASHLARLAPSLGPAIFKACPLAMAVVEASSGRIVELNASAVRLLGGSRGDLTDRTLHELGLLDEADQRDLLQRLQAEHRPPTQTLHMQEPGGVRAVQAAFHPLWVEGDALTLCVIVDSETDGSATLWMDEARFEAEQVTRMKSAFLTNMTHEVKTPLTVILGFTSMLKQGVRDDYQRFIRVIERSGRRLLRVLDSMLDLAHLEAGILRLECSRFNVADVVRRVTDEMASMADEKGLYIRAHLPEEHVYAQLDYEILERVLTNLIDNSIKFTEEGGIEVKLRQEQDELLLELSDTGIGIDEEFLPHLFSPFQQESTGLARTHQGNGLGLAVTKRLVELMGGQVRVASKKGQGSTFSLVLPLDCVPDQPVPHVS